MSRLWGDDLPEFPDDNSHSEGDEFTPAIFTTEHAKEWAISHCYSSCFSCKAGLRLIKEKAIGGDLAGHIEGIERGSGRLARSTEQRVKALRLREG